MSKIVEIIQEYLNDFIDAVLDIALVVISIITLLSGCVTTTDDASIQYHPSWPIPYKTCKVTWKVITLDQPYVALTYNDSLTLASCNLDIYRYIQEMNTKFCVYRPEGDKRCVQEKN